MNTVPPPRVAGCSHRLVRRVALILPALLLVPGCAATFSMASGVQASKEYEPTPAATVKLEDSTLHAERAELRVTVAGVSATGVDLSVEQREVCPVATLSRETFASTRPPKAGHLAGALLIDLVATGLVAGGVAYAGMQDPDMSPREWQRNTALAAGAGGGVMLIGAGAWLYPTLAATRNSRSVDYTSVWCSDWAPALPSRLEARVGDATLPASIASMSTAATPLALTAEDADLAARRAQLDPAWLALEIAPPAGLVDVAYGAAPWSARGGATPIPAGTPVATHVRPDTGTSGITAAGLGRLVWGRGEAAPAPMRLYVDVKTAGAAPGKGMDTVLLTAAQLGSYGDAWRCAALADGSGPAPWAGTSAGEMRTVLDRLEPSCPDAVATTRAAVCRIGAGEAANSAAGSLTLKVDDLSAYDTCPDSPWRETFQTVLDRNVAEQRWPTAYATIATYTPHWGAAWRDAALAKLVPADVRHKAATARSARDLRAALDVLSAHGGALPAPVVTQLQATVAGRTAAVLATPDGTGDVSDRWLSDAQELADALPASAAASVRARVAAVEAEIVSAAERDIKVHVAERDYDAAVSRAASASDAYPSGARIAAWAEKKNAALRAQSDAWEAAEAARQAAEERREAARQAAEERREAARQAAAARREAAECKSAGFYGAKVCDRAGRRYYNGTCWCTDYWLVKKEPGNFSGTCSPCLTQ